MRRQFFVGILLGALVATVTFFVLSNVPITRAFYPPAIPTVSNVNAKYFQGIGSPSVFLAARDGVAYDNLKVKGALQVKGNVNAKSIDTNDLNVTGNLQQSVPTNGLVKAGAAGRCYYATDGLDKQFDAVDNQPIVIQYNAGFKSCTLTFGFDLSERFVISLPADPTTFVYASPFGGNKVDIIIKNQNGDPVDGYFNLMIY